MRLTLHLDNLSVSSINALIFKVFIYALFFLPTTLIAKQSQSTYQTPLIMGYYSQWAVYGPNVFIRELPTQLMTHLVYKSADLTESGEVILGDPFADIEHLYPGADRDNNFLGSIGQLISIKKSQPTLKSIISIGGWGRSQHFSTLAASSAGREKIAKNAIKFMKKYHFDGIEIDWQFPIYRTTRNDIVSHRENDGEHLSLLLAEIRRQCVIQRVDCWLQAILAPYSIKLPWNAKLLSESTDVIVIDVTRLPGDKGDFAEPQSPLFATASEPSIDGIINNLVDYGVNQQKIVLTIASFAVGWEGVPAINNGFKQRPKSLSWGSWDSQNSGATGVYNQKNLAYFLSSNDYQTYWDDFGKTSYVYNPNKYGGHFIAFENERAIAAKVDFAKDKRLAGVAIRQLHNGDKALIDTFDEYHFFKSRWYKTVKFWQENSDALIVLFQMLAVIVIGIVLFIVLQNKKNRELYEQRQTFNRLQYWLQSIEWPLLNVVTTATKAKEKSLLSAQQLDAIQKLSSDVLSPISAILSETKLKSSVNQVFKEVVDLQQIIQNVATLALLDNNILISWNKQVHAKLIINPDSFQQFLYYLCDYVANLSPKHDAMSIDIVTIDSTLALVIKIPKIAENDQLSHTRINGLHHQAKAIGLNLVVDKLKGVISVFIERDIVQQQHASESLAFNFEQQLLPYHQQAALLDANCASDPSEQEKIQASPNVHKSELSSLFLAITSFNLSTAPSKDIYKGLEQACQYFIDILQQDSKITIIHHEQLVAKLGNESLTSTHEVLVNADDITVEIITQENLMESEQQLIQVLVYQTLMVQKAIQSLLKEPTVLSELYELTRFKDKINYLKAESGYTGIYLQGKKEPRYISMRLRTVRLYFDDTFLLQIHRSYLVNPKKVSHIEQTSKLKFSLIIGNEKLPVSRTYISSLKDLYPQWFK